MAQPFPFSEDPEIGSATPTSDLPTLPDPGRPLFLREPTWEPEELEPEEEPAAGDQIGPYRLVRLLGEGGFGVVYLAEQTEPLRRMVALKLIRGRDHRLLRRFAVERQALARMSHPHVAQVFSAGVSPDGRPYIVLEYVPGVAITRFCDDHRLGLAERLEVFAAVCDAVQHAHQKAVLHRDLKPSNILVTESAEGPQPKVIDFGIAKALDHPLALTADHGVIGTIAYLSPEAIVQGGDLDTRSDVYSLGVVLYELLAGGSPFRRSSDLALMNRIVEGDVEPPSAFFLGNEAPAREVTAARRCLDPKGLRRALRGDLDAIVLKAMARERGERYASAAELAADIRRHLAHEPVLAVPPGALYQAGKFARRHRAAVAAGLLAALVLVGGIVSTTLEARRANREAARANREAETARQVAGFLASLFKESDPARQGRDLTARQILDRGAERIHLELERQPLVRARLLASVGGVYRTLSQYAKSEALLREALAIQRVRLRRDDPEIAETLYNLAAVLRESGQSPEVAVLMEEAIRIYRGHGDTYNLASCLVELSSYRQQQGRYPEAERLLLEALALREADLGPGHEKVSRILNNLGNLYYDVRRFDDSARVQKRALLIKQRTLGPDHPFIAKSLNNLANVYIEQGRLQEAEALHRQALAIRLKSFEPGHVEIGVSYNNLGDVALKRGRFAEAAAFYGQALATWDSSLAPDHPFRAYALHGLADCERGLGHPVEARDLDRRALAIAEARLAPKAELVEVIRGALEGRAAGR
jgi:eukaryotic-like serine/threonine-protein kinase